MTKIARMKFQDKNKSSDGKTPRHKTPTERNGNARISFLQDKKRVAEVMKWRETVFLIFSSDKKSATQYLSDPNNYCTKDFRSAFTGKNNPD
jgi:hypothetical protein